MPQQPPPPKAPLPPKPLVPKMPAGRASARAAAPAALSKAFSITPWAGQGEGEKIIIYGESGIGKTTLAAGAPGLPVFLGLDDGGRKIRNPHTGEPVLAVQNVTTFDDLRAVIQNHALFDGHKVVVIDTVTKVEEIMEPWMFAHVKSDKGATVNSIEGYGWGKGYKHSQDTMRLLLSDLEGLVRKGITVILLCQENAITMPNAEGLDYLQAGPKLHHTKQFSTRLDVQEWADHVFRIGFLDNTVVGSKDAKVGKIAAGNAARVIYTSNARHFFAKSRTLKDPIISFEDETDDSVWRLLLPHLYDQ